MGMPWPRSPVPHCISPVWVEGGGEEGGEYGGYQCQFWQFGVAQFAQDMDTLRTQRAKVWYVVQEANASHLQCRPPRYDTRWAILLQAHARDAVELRSRFLQSTFPVPPSCSRHLTSSMTHSAGVQGENSGSSMTPVMYTAANTHGSMARFHLRWPDRAARMRVT